jgi:hypothetical protein
MPDSMPEPVRIVREPELPRIAAAGRAVAAEMLRPRPSGMWTPELLAPAFASRAIAADDDHGRAHGLVVQADGMNWEELDALADLAAAQLDTSAHGGVGAWHPRCRTCSADGAYRRVTAHRRYRTVGPATPHDGNTP